MTVEEGALFAPTIRRRCGHKETRDDQASSALQSVGPLGPQTDESSGRPVKRRPEDRVLLALT